MNQHIAAQSCPTNRRARRVGVPSRPLSKPWGSHFSAWGARSAALASVAFFHSQSAQAASGTWNNGGADNNWRTTTNWNPVGIPGSTTAASFASTEDATFSNVGSGTINLGDFMNIRTIFFGVGAGDANSFTIGDANDVLNFSNNGGVTINAGVTANEAMGVAGTVINLTTTAGGAAAFTNNGSGLLTIAGDVKGNSSSSDTLTVTGSGNTSITGNLSAAAGTLALTKTGTGTLSLSGATNSLGGNLLLGAGRINVTAGSTSVGTASGGFNSIGNVASTTGLVSVSSGATFSFAATAGNNGGNFGGATSATGVLYNSGTYTVTGTTANNSGIYLGNAASSYGYLRNNTGATTTVSGRLWIGAAGVAAGATGVLDVTGGTVTVSGTNQNEPLRINGDGNSHATSTSYAGVNLVNGTLTVAKSGAQTNIGGNTGTANTYTSFNITGTGKFTAGTLDSGIGLGVSSSATNIATLSVSNGGTLETSYMYGINALGTNVLNFDNGTIRAIATNGGGLIQSGNFNVYIHSGGMTVDSNTFNPLIGAALLAASGNGVTSIALGGTATGYVGAPVVKISSGGGTGAAAVANFDPVTGAVTGITITSPGTGYTSAPTITLVGGNGGSTGAGAGTATGTASIAAVTTGGGVTKTGAGTLTLTNVNTYTGNTLISAGTLALTGSGSIAYSPLITVGSAAGSAAKFDVSGVTGGTYAVPNGQTIKGGGTVVAGTINLGTGSALAPGNSPGTLAVTGNVGYNSGGTYQWEVNNATGTKGADPGYDWNNITGILNIGSSSGSTFGVDVRGLSLANTAGVVTNWNPTGFSKYTLATASGGITNYSSDKFAITTTNFTNNNALRQGALSVQKSGNDLVLVFNSAGGGSGANGLVQGLGVFASDNASQTAYTGGNLNGQNGGFGYGAFAANSIGGFAGSFVGDAKINGGGNSGNFINSTGAKSWGMFSNTNNTSDNTRTISGGVLATGRTLSLDFDNGFANGTSSQGISLRNSSSNNVFEFFYDASSGKYKYTDGSGTVTTTQGFTGDGIHTEFTQTSATGYTFTISGPGITTQTFSGSVINATGGTAVDRFRTFAFNSVGADTSSDFNAFFNSPIVALATFNGQGGATGNFSTATNWAAHTPVNGGSIAFDGTGSTVNNDNLTSVYNIAFNASGTPNTGNTTTNAGAYTLTGNALTINGGIDNNSTSLQTINHNLTLGASQTFNATNGALTFGGTLALNGKNPTINAANTVTMGGIISGNGDIYKTGSGTLALNAANTFTGDNTNNRGQVFITDGAVRVGHNSALGTQTGGVSVDLGDSVTGGSTTHFSNNGSLLANSGLTIANQLYVDTNTGGSTRTIGSDGTTGAVTYSGNVLLTGSAILTAATGGNVTFSGTLGTPTFTAGGITKSGAGTVILTGNNGYTGTTTVSAGILNIQNATGLGTTAAGTSVSNGATLQLQGGITVGAEALSLNGGAASGQTGALVNVSGTNTYGGAITVASSSSISALTGSTLNLTGGIIKIGTTATLTGGGIITLGITGISGSSANSDLIVDGATVNENVANTYNGPTYIRNGGILNANVANAWPTANGRTAVTMDDSGTGSSNLTLGASQSAASLTGAATSTVALGANTLTVGAASGSTTFAGVISGTNGNLNKDGASTQVLSGTNTYTGATTVTNGALKITGSLSGTTAVNINAGTLLLGASNVLNDAAAVNLGGGTLNTGGFRDTLGALTLTANSTIDFGTGNASELTFSTLTLGSNNLNIWNWTTTNGFSPDGGTAGDGLRDRLLFTTLGTLSATDLSQIHFFSDGGTTVLGDGRQISFGGNQELVPVPEPTTIFGALALVGLVGYRERRRFWRTSQS